MHQMTVRGFTLVEMLVVLAVLALLLGIAAPRYVEHVDRAREAVLRQNLATMRDAIDKFKSDRDRFPHDLQELVQERYLKAVPVDPMTESSDTWQILNPVGASTGELSDVHSGAPGAGRDQSLYASW